MISTCIQKSSITLNEKVQPTEWGKLAGICLPHPIWDLAQLLMGGSKKQVLLRRRKSQVQRNVGAYTHIHTHIHATYGSQFPWHIHQVPVVGIRRTEHCLFARVQRIHERSIPTDGWPRCQLTHTLTVTPFLHHETTVTSFFRPGSVGLTEKDASPQETALSTAAVLSALC